MIGLGHTIVESVLTEFHQVCPFFYKKKLQLLSQWLFADPDFPSSPKAK